MAAFQPSFFSFTDPNFKVTAPGVTTSLAATITDTGIRLKVLGDLTICTVGTSESIGIVCRNCNGLSTHLRPWTRCPACEEFLWEAAGPPLPPRAFRLDCATGQLIEESRRKATDQLPNATEGQPSLCEEPRRKAINPLPNATEGQPKRSEEPRRKATDQLPKATEGRPNRSEGPRRKADNSLPNVTEGQPDTVEPLPETPELPVAAPEPIAATLPSVGDITSPKTSRGYGRGQLNRLIRESLYRVDGLRDESAGSGKIPGERVPTSTVTVQTTCTTIPVTAAETIVATTTVTTSPACSLSTVPTRGFVEGPDATTLAGARNLERSRREGSLNLRDHRTSTAEEGKPWALRVPSPPPTLDFTKFDFGDPNSDPEEIYMETVITHPSTGASNWPECTLRDRRDATAASAIKSPETPVLPGCGDPKQLPKLARAHRVIQKKVAQDYGFQYPYAPPWVLDEVEDWRNHWIADAIWDHLGIPESHRGPGLTPQIGLKFDECLMTWNYGRHIHCDRVVVKRPGRKDSVYYITTVDKEGYSVTLPDPQFYW